MRPEPADGRPVLGAPEAAPGVWIAFTHSGVTLAPAIAALAVEEILGGGRAAGAAPWRVERFA